MATTMSFGPLIVYPCTFPVSCLVVELVVRVEKGIWVGVVMKVTVGKFLSS